MKKTSFLILLILSVFFSYKTAFAVVVTRIQDTAVVTTGGNVTHTLGWFDTSGYYQGYLCKGTYPTCSDYLGATAGYPENWGSWSNNPAGSTVVNLLEGYYGTTKTDGNYFYVIANKPNWWGEDRTEYWYNFYKSGGLWYVGTGSSTIPADGLESQLTPVASSSIPYNMSFAGTYNNYYGSYRTIIATTTTGTPSIYASTSATLETGVGLSYNLPLVLSPNQAYEYTIILCDSSGYTCTSPTSPVSFTTNGLTGAISPPVWTAESCTWTDFSTWTGCLDNVFHDLFSPSAESLTQYQGLYAQFINKPPFGYIVAIQNALRGINITATSPFALESMPILNTYIFDPIRLALIWVLWVAFAFVLYHRLKNIAI